MNPPASKENDGSRQHRGNGGLHNPKEQQAIGIAHDVGNHSNHRIASFCQRRCSGHRVYRRSPKYNSTLILMANSGPNSHFESFQRWGCTMSWSEAGCLPVSLSARTSFPWVARAPFLPQTKALQGHPDIRSMRGPEKPVANRVGIRPAWLPGSDVFYADAGKPEMVLTIGLATKSGREYGCLLRFQGASRVLLCGAGSKEQGARSREQGATSA